MANNQPVAFTPRTADRIRQTVDRVLGTPKGSTPSPDRGRSVKLPTARGKVTTAIPAGTYDSPTGAGKVQIQRKTSTGWADWGDPVQVYNQFGGGEVAVGVGVLLIRVDGDWFVAAADCPV